MLTIEYLDITLKLNKTNHYPRVIYVEHHNKKESGLYDLLTSEKKGRAFIFLYQAQISNKRLPEFITITETDMNIAINYTKCVL